MRRSWFAALLVAVALAAAAPAHAGDPPVEAGGHAAGGHGEDKGLIDAYLDPMTAIAAIAVFVVLLVVLTKTAWKPILDGLQQREATIRKAVDDAAEASAKAQALVREYEQKLATAKDEARAILDEGRKDAEALKVRIQQEATAAAEATMARAARDIEQNAARAYDQVLRQVAAIATEAAGRIVRHRLDVEGHAEIVDSVVKDFAGAQRRA